MSRYHYSGPSIDHSGLSPSGRVSKAARKAFLAREAARLFPPGYWDQPEPSDTERARQEVERLTRHAATLRDLAARGMSKARFTRAASALEAEAAAINAKLRTCPCGGESVDCVAYDDEGWPEIPGCGECGAVLGLGSAAAATSGGEGRENEDV